MTKTFITGIGGCVGHYLFEELAGNPNRHLYLLVRNPQKLKFNPAEYKNVTVIQDDLMNIERHAAIVSQANQVVHLSADWGGEKGNYDQSLMFFNLLDPQICRKVIYFSTASILGPDNRPIPAAEKLGTPYIRSKYRFFNKLPELKIYPRIITLFPTWVLGGDGRKYPFSHASEGLLALKKWLWLIRFLTADASFHFIHARDAARIAVHLLENEVKEKEFVLGNSPVTVGQFIRETCRFYGVPVYFQIPISLEAIKIFAALSGRKLQPWDLYCFQRRHFLYQTVNTRGFGLAPGLESVADILKNS